MQRTHDASEPRLVAHEVPTSVTEEAECCSEVACAVGGSVASIEEIDMSSSVADGSSKTAEVPAKRPAGSMAMLVVHSLLCTNPDQGCPIAQCGPMRFLLKRLKTHSQQCQCDSSHCSKCVKWRQLVELRRRALVKLIAHVRAKRRHSAAAA